MGHYSRAISRRQREGENESARQEGRKYVSARGEKYMTMRENDERGEEGVKGRNIASRGTIGEEPRRSFPSFFARNSNLG